MAESLVGRGSALHAKRTRIEDGPRPSPLLAMRLYLLVRLVDLAFGPGAFSADALIARLARTGAVRLDARAA